jgi:hypothetical protein
MFRVLHIIPLSLWKNFISLRMLHFTFLSLHAYILYIHNETKWLFLNITNKQTIQLQWTSLTEWLFLNLPITHYIIITSGEHRTWITIKQSMETLYLIIFYLAVLLTGLFRGSRQTWYSLISCLGRLTSLRPRLTATGVAPSWLRPICGDCESYPPGLVGDKRGDGQDWGLWTWSGLLSEGWTGGGTHSFLPVLIGWLRYLFLNWLVRSTCSDVPNCTKYRTDPNFLQIMPGSHLTPAFLCFLTKMRSPTTNFFLKGSTGTCLVTLSPGKSIGRLVRWVYLEITSVIWITDVGINLYWQTDWLKTFLKCDSLISSYWHVSLRSNPLTVCTAFSVAPLLSGWCAGECKNCMLLDTHQAANRAELKGGPLSDRIMFGAPNVPIKLSNRSITAAASDLDIYPRLDPFRITVH